MSTIQYPRKTWLATGSPLTVWLRMPSLGLRLSPRLLALAIACLPLCLWWGQGPVHSWLALLWYLLSPLFCEQARLCLKAFHGKVLSPHPPPRFFFSSLSFPLSGYPTVWVAISHSVQFSRSVMSDSMRPHESQHARPPCPQLPEFTQTHVHRVGDAIQPSHPLLSPSPPAPNPSQHQSLFQ